MSSALFRVVQHALSVCPCFCLRSTFAPSLECADGLGFVFATFYELFIYIITLLNFCPFQLFSSAVYEEDRWKRSS